MKILQGMLLYVQVQTPVENYNKDGKEYKVSVCVDEDCADEFDSLYPKQAAKKVKRTDFEKQYKVAPPEGTEKNLYVITLKKPAQFKDKETGEQKPIPEQYRPQVFQMVDGVKTNITQDVLPANGSYGKVSIEHFENNYGAIARLGNVMVTELIPYEKSAGGTQERGNEFDADDDNGGTVKVPPKAVAKAKAKSAPVNEGDLDEPF